MRALWRLSWDNQPLEPLWRVVLGVTVGAGGHDLAPRSGCPCGEWRPPGPPGLAGGQRRAHCFWGCAVARADVQALRAELPAHLPDLTPAHLWLHRPPGGVTGPVWSLVCIMAVHAMDRGRAKLWALTRQRADATGLDQARITDYYRVLGATADAAGDGPVPGGPDREVAQASAAAVATFWGSVVAFAETVEGVPRGWPDDLPTDHPFLAVRGGKVVVPRVP